jgi:hypothetical protein
MLQYLELKMLAKICHILFEKHTSTSDSLPTVRIANLGPGLKLSSKIHEKWKKPNATARWLGQHEPNENFASKNIPCQSAVNHISGSKLLSSAGPCQIGSNPSGLVLAHC